MIENSPFRGLVKDSIEQLAETDALQPRSSVCETPGRPYLLGLKPDGKSAILVQPDCGLWSCDHCAEKKKSEWFLHAMRGAAEIQSRGQQAAMITLTSRGGRGRTRERAQAAFEAGFPKLRKRVKYYQDTWSYLAVPEQHKNGIMHMHILANNELPRRWWKDTAYSCGLGFMADVSIVTQASDAAWEVSKYIGKQLKVTYWPPGFRRVRTSRDWPKAQLPIDTSWTWQTFFDWQQAYLEATIAEHYGAQLDIRCKPPGANPQMID